MLFELLALKAKQKKVHRKYTTYFLISIYPTNRTLANLKLHFSELICKDSKLRGLGELQYDLHDILIYTIKTK